MRISIRTGLFLLPVIAAMGCGSSSTSSLASISVSPSSSSIMMNGAQPFTATARDGNGNVKSGVTFTWSSTANDVATVNSDGVATGIAAGTTEISASAGGVTSPPATLIVAPPPPPSLLGNWEIAIPDQPPIGYLGATTAGITLQSSTMCGDVGLPDSTSCYEAISCTDGNPYCIEWVRGICTANNGTNPHVQTFYLGQSGNEVTFNLHATVDTSAYGSAPPFTVIGTGTIIENGSQLQMSGTWSVSNPTSACTFISGTWTGVSPPNL